MPNDKLKPLNQFYKTVSETRTQKLFYVATSDLYHSRPTTNRLTLNRFLTVLATVQLPRPTAILKLDTHLQIHRAVNNQHKRDTKEVIKDTKKVI